MSADKCKKGKTHSYQIQSKAKCKNGVPLWICALCGDKVYSM